MTVLPAAPGSVPPAAPLTRADFTYRGYAAIQSLIAGHDMQIGTARRDEREVVVFPPCDRTAEARVAERRETLDSLAGIRVQKTILGEAKNLPPKQQGRYYIASKLVAVAARRSDVFSPHTFSRDAVRDPENLQGFLSIPGFAVFPAISDLDVRPLKLTEENTYVLEKDGVRFVNLGVGSANVRCGDVHVTIPGGREVLAKLITSETPLPPVGEFAVTSVNATGVILPPRVPGTIYIVPLSTAEVANAIGREDIVGLDSGKDAMRSGNQITLYAGFIQYPAHPRLAPAIIQPPPQRRAVSKL